MPCAPQVCPAAHCSPALHVHDVERVLQKVGLELIVFLAASGEGGGGVHFQQPPAQQNRNRTSGTRSNQAVYRLKEPAAKAGGNLGFSRS